MMTQASTPRALLTAPLEEEWLQKHADAMARQVDRNLPKGRGNQPMMYVAKAVPDVDQRMVRVYVRIKGPVSCWSSHPHVFADNFTMASARSI